MMMTGRSRVSKSNVPGVLLLVGLIAFLLFGSVVGPYVQSAFLDLLKWGNPDNAYDGLSRDALIERLTAAETELSRIQYQGVLHQLLADENAELKNASSVRSFSKVVPARVIARPPRILYDNLLLDVGVASGIKENDLVVWNGVLLGSITSVGPATATARLFSTSGVTHDAVLGEPRAVAVMKGVGGGAFELALPQNVIVEKGDPVRAQHSDTLIIGTVVSFTAKPSDATQTVLVRSPVSIQELDYVSIIPPENI